MASVCGDVSGSLRGISKSAQASRTDGNEPVAAQRPQQALIPAPGPPRPRQPHTASLGTDGKATDRGADPGQAAADSSDRGPAAHQAVRPPSQQQLSRSRGHATRTRSTCPGPHPGASLEHIACGRLTIMSRESPSRTGHLGPLALHRLMRKGTPAASPETPLPASPSAKINIRAAINS